MGGRRSSSANRLTTVHHLDRIVVLQGGTVAEVGGGQELLDQEGAYARLYRAGQYKSAPDLLVQHEA